MSRRQGRKRRGDVDRHPSGQITRSNYDNPQAVALVRRIRHECDRFFTDPRVGSQLGRLAIEGYLDSDEYDAGLSWAELTFRHSQAIGFMLPKCKAIDWEGGQGRSLAQEPSEETIQAVKVKKEDADRRIRSVGLGAHAEMTKVIICDEPPGNRLLLKRACQALARK